MSLPAASPTLRELLDFYKEAGVDAALEEQGVDRFNRAAEKAKPPAPPKAQASAAPATGPVPPSPREPQPASPPRIGNATVPDLMQTALAREAASSAETLDALHAAMERFEGCNLRLTAKQLVFADGNPNAKLMLVGEAPGRDEDIEGRPFVGRSGQLLDRILATIGLDRTSVYIANVVPWRPPGNRTPTPHETEICRPFIERQIELVGPEVLVTLGGPSAKTLLNQTDGILKLRGKWRKHVTPGGIEVPAMPTLHPAYLLRNPAHKKLAWRDFLEVRQRLGA